MEPQLQSSSTHTSATGVGCNTPREHILLWPDDYIGSVKKRTQKLWVYEGTSMVQREVTYVPGLLKIFDEILVYAADNKQRDPTMDTLRVEVDVAKCRISIYNNGEGIPIEADREYGVLLPEVIFGPLCISDNMEITSGMNSYGVKLANIFSTEFIVEIADGPGQKKYKQVFSENMGCKSEPQITGYRKGMSWTMFTFKPDLAMFNLTHLEDDVVLLMKKRVFDMAGILGMTVQIVFNGQTIMPFKSFPHYAYKHIMCASMDRKEELPWIFEKLNDKWEVCVSLSDGQFQQVSFVNKTATTGGGTHVNYVTDLIASHVANALNKSFKGARVKHHNVKEHLWVFVNALIKYPTFDSPTKEALVSPQEGFGPDTFSNLFLSKVTESLTSKVLAHLASRRFSR